MYDLDVLLLVSPPMYFFVYDFIRYFYGENKLKTETVWPRYILNKYNIPSDILPNFHFQICISISYEGHLKSCTFLFIALLIQRAAA